MMIYVRGSAGTYGYVRRFIGDYAEVVAQSGDLIICHVRDLIPADEARRRVAQPSRYFKRTHPRRRFG